MSVFHGSFKQEIAVLLGTYNLKAMKLLEAIKYCL